MTISDKRKIEAYRESSVPYSEIAETLSLPLNTVKSYCKHHNLGGRRERTADNILLCKQCGEGVPQTPHRKAKIFCSDKCRIYFPQESSAPAVVVISDLKSGTPPANTAV